MRRVYTMNKKRVETAADLRGIYFDGVKKWRNNCVGFAYEVYSPAGCGFIQADTLRGLYSYIMKYPKIKA